MATRVTSEGSCVVSADADVSEQPAALPTVPATSAGGDWDTVALPVDCAKPNAPTTVPTIGAGSDESGVQAGAGPGVGTGTGSGIGSVVGVGAGVGDGPDPLPGPDDEPPSGAVAESAPSAASGRVLLSGDAGASGTLAT